MIPFTVCIWCCMILNYDSISCCSFYSMRDWWELFVMVNCFIVFLCFTFVELLTKQMIPKLLNKSHHLSIILFKSTVKKCFILIYLWINFKLLTKINKSFVVWSSGFIIDGFLMCIFSPEMLLLLFFTCVNPPFWVNYFIINNSCFPSYLSVIIFFFILLIDGWWI